MRRFEDHDTWGLVASRDLSALAVQIARDAIKQTPVMANQMLAVGRTIWDWAIPLDLAKLNPFDKVKDLDIPDRGHVPWPAWVIDYVRAHAWPALVRMVRLGVMTCQRESDLIRMGPIHRESLHGRDGRGTGIWCRPKKTRRRRRSVFIPLRTADALELDRWAETPITFTNTRWKAPRAVHNPDAYLPRGKSLRARWHRWLGKTDAGRQVCAKWKGWLAQQVARYEWEVDPDDVKGPTIHGLRGTGVLTRWAEGFDVDQISNDIGMSRQMVDHYMRFKDQMGLAADGRRRLRLVTKEP